MNAKSFGLGMFAMFAIIVLFLGIVFVYESGKAAGFRVVEVNRTVEVVVIPEFDRIADCVKLEDESTRYYCDYEESRWGI